MLFRPKNLQSQYTHTHPNPPMHVPIKRYYYHIVTNTASVDTDHPNNSHRLSEGSTEIHLCAELSRFHTVAFWRAALLQPLPYPAPPLPCCYGEFRLVSWLVLRFDDITGVRRSLKHRGWLFVPTDVYACKTTFISVEWSWLGVAFRHHYMVYRENIECITRYLVGLMFILYCSFKASFWTLVQLTYLLDSFDLF